MKKIKAKKLSVVLSLMLAGGTASSGFATSASIPISDFSTEIANNTLSLNQQYLVDHLVKRNAQIIYAQMQKDIARQQIAHERGAFEVEFFSNLRYEDSNVQTTAADTTTLQYDGQLTFDQQQTTFETGFAALVKTGAEFRISYRTNKKTNNFIPNAPEEQNPDKNDTEYTGSINIAITQPLLRGLGAKQIDAKIKQAELEHLIVVEQYKQRLMRSTFDGLNAYWQLYRLAEIRKVREEALLNAKESVEDIRLRVEAGRLPETTLLEAQSNQLNRQAELIASLNAYSEGVSRIKTLLHFTTSTLDEINVVMLDKPDETTLELSGEFETYFNSVLANWSSHRIALAQKQVYQQNLVGSRDAKKPRLDLTLGYSTNGMGYEFSQSNQNLEGFDYPSWYAGLNFSMPLQGNRRAQAQIRMAETRMQQAAVDISAVEKGLSNDLQVRLGQIYQAHDELRVYRENVELLENLLKVERDLFDSGMRRLSDVHDRESRLNQGKQRYIDAKVKYEAAKLSLYLADGSLLSRYNINVAGVN